MRSVRILFLGIIFLAKIVTAQVSVNINFGTPPLWGPVGYTEVRYYYLPDVEAYYDIQTSMFIYYGGGVWISRSYLPARYRDYDLYSGYKVVLTDYRGNTPYVYFDKHKAKYYKGYRGAPQKTIGARPGKGNSEKGNYGGGGNKGKHQGHGGGKGKKK